MPCITEMPRDCFQKSCQSFPDVILLLVCNHLFVTLSVWAVFGLKHSLWIAYLQLMKEHVLGQSQGLCCELVPRGYQEKLLLSKSDQALKQAAWRGDGVSIPKGVQKTRQCGI